MTGRVLHANADFGTTTETFVRDRMLELDRIGWEAWVAARTVSNRDANPFPPDERLFVTPVPGLPRRVFDKLLRRPPERRAVLRWIDRPLREVRPDLVHAHFGWVAASVQPAVAAHGVPLVPSFHGYDVTVWPRTVSGDPYRELFARCPRVLAVSEYIAEVLRDLGYEGSIVVVPSGIRLERFPFHEAREGEGVRLLYVGRLIPYKGVDDLLRALPSVPGARLDVIGDGSERAACEALARELGVNVVFHGALPHAAVAQALIDADVVVMPSRTGADGRVEALGNIVKEALASGREVVATRSGGIPEVIPPDRRAELVPEYDPPALADAINAALARRAEWPERARAGRAWVEQHFDWQLLAPRIAAVYEDTLRDGY
jgi:glycosyltransferase involved in cell wall biosynthesis